MNMVMSEINFIHMHKTVVTEVVSRTTITKSINMMKLNSVVRRPSTVEDEQEQLETPIPPTQAKSVARTSTSTRTPRKRGKKRNHDEISEDNATPSATSETPDIVYIPKYREVAMQTVTEEELLTQEEEYFQTEHIERVRQVLTIDFIKEEDFDSEYPQSEIGDD